MPDNWLKTLKSSCMYTRNLRGHHGQQLMRYSDWPCFHRCFWLTVLPRGVQAGRKGSCKTVQNLTLDVFWSFLQGPNKLSGTLPPSWSALSKLESLSLARTQLKTTLPQSWSAMAALKILTLNDNRHIQGPLPVSWSNLQALKQLNLAFSSFNGTLPPSWSRLGALSSLSLVSNQLQGTLPSSWSALTKIQSLDLRSNKLQGTLPPAWAALGWLDTFLISGNNFSGTVPRQYGRLSYMKWLEAHSNPLLHGCLPSEWKGRDLTNGYTIFQSLSGKTVRFLTMTNITGFC